jgi:hypothetical protein
LDQQFGIPAGRAEALPLGLLPAPEALEPVDDVEPTVLLAFPGEDPLALV